MKTSPQLLPRLLFTALLVVLGDIIIQVASVGKFPSSSVDWTALLQPEIVNVVAVLVVFGGLLLTPMFFRNPAGASVLAAIAATALHRYRAGENFNNTAMAIVAVVFFLLYQTLEYL